MDAHAGASVAVNNLNIRRRSLGQGPSPSSDSDMFNVGSIFNPEPVAVLPKAKKRYSLDDRRPVHSSPLAGPALSHSPLPLLRGEIDPTIAPPLILITPCPSVAMSSTEDVSPSKRLVRFAGSPRMDQRPNPVPDSNTSPASRSPTRSSFHQTYNHKLSPSSPPVELLPPVPGSSPLPQLPPASHKQPKLSSPPASLAGKHARSTVVLTSQNQPPSFTTTPPSPATRRHTFPPPSTSDSGFDHWMATNTYATIPRFSRLGINASHVVLPIPARQYKRVGPSRKEVLRRKMPLARASTESETSATSSLETLQLSSSSSGSVASSLDLEVATVTEEGVSNNSKAKLEDFSQHIIRCARPPSIYYSCESFEPHISLGTEPSAVVGEECLLDNIPKSGPRELSPTEAPGLEAGMQGKGTHGCLRRFWKRLVKIRNWRG